MNAATLNQQLKAIYQPYLSHLYRQEWPSDISAPLLMHVFEEYCQMPVKVLLVGQETHGWGHMSEQPTVEMLQHWYTDFKLGQHADYGDGKKPRYLRSPFWNFCRSYFSGVNAAGGFTRKTCGFLWTNISKFDSNTTTPHADLQQRNKPGFELLKQELAIVQPDAVVFMTGTKYDYWLDQLFTPEREPLLDDGLLTLLHDATGLLPRLSFQTKHPRTLCLQKSYRPVLDKLIQVLLG